MSERDTKFAGFAKLLWEEDLEIALGIVGLEIKNKNFPAHIQKIIAMRVYDLVRHTRYHVIRGDNERMSERDTHFLGSAKALLKQVYNTGGKWIDTPDIHADEQWEQLFAQYTYDLVAHAISASQGLEYAPAKAIMDTIPDMTEWPKIADNWWYTQFLASQRPDFVSLIRWIQEELKRDIGTITNIRIECEVVQIAPKDGWKQYERGQRMFFEVEFQDGVHEVYHVYTDGRRCLEDANWRYPQ